MKGRSKSFLYRPKSSKHVITERLSRSVYLAKVLLFGVAILLDIETSKFGWVFLLSEWWILDLTSPNFLEVLGVPPK